MDFRLLGPFEVLSGGMPVPLGGAKPRSLLAALVLERGKVVHTNHLIDIIWGDNPPGSSRALIQTYVSTLRQTLTQHGGPEIILTRGPGYLADVPAEAVDLEVFEQLVAQGRQAAPEVTAVVFREALALWRGPALAGLTDGLRNVALRLDELRVSITEERISAELALGQHNRLVPELSALIKQHPVNERFRGQLMMVLYRLGRQADALATYRDCQQVLAEELGIDPGPELQELHRAILRGELTAPAPVLPTERVIPAQLPHRTSDFTGREQAIAILTEPSLPMIRTIAGPGGTGKSTLAGQVAELLAPSYPDGQVYADLRGMSNVPADPDEVLGRFLRALGVGATKVPAPGDERAELYRTLIAGRRLLIVLDDALNEAQVEPLLPGSASPQCTVLITSRERLTALAGAHLTELGVMPTDEALEFLSKIVGNNRTQKEPQAAIRIVEHCGHLPLALRIAGTRLAKRQRLPLSWLAERLADENARLDELSKGDRSIRASMELSYRGLSPDTATALRRLGFLGIPDFAPWVVAWLMSTSLDLAEDLVESLVDAQLVEFVGVDRTGSLRYRQHDLVRLFARERAEHDDNSEDRYAAVSRVLFGWLGVIRQSITAAPPDDIRWPMPEPGAFPALACVTVNDAQAWFEAENASLVAGVERAAAIGLHQLAAAFAPDQYSAVVSGAGRYERHTRIVKAVLTAARQAGDPRIEAAMLTDLGHLRYLQDRFGDARLHLQAALSLFRDMADLRGQATALAGLGTACREPGHLMEAVHFLDESAQMMDALGDDTGIGYARRMVGSVWLELGAYDHALSDLEASLAAYRRVGSKRGEALTLRTLSMHHRARNQYESAIKLASESRDIFREMGQEFLEAYAVRSLAKAQLRAGILSKVLPQLEWSLSVSQKVNDHWGQGATLRVIGELHLERGELDLAEEFLNAAIAVWDTMEAPLWRARTERDLSYVYAARGDKERAAALLDQCVKAFHERSSREYAELTADL